MGLLLDMMADKDIEKQVNAEEVIVPAFQSDEEADEAFAKVLWAQNKIAENEKKVKAKKAELMEALKDYDQRLNGSLRSFVEFRTEQLRTYAMSKLKGKKGALPLFHGNIRLKEDLGSVEIDNEEELVNYLRKTGMFEQCAEDVPKINKTKLKGILKKDESGHYFVDGAGNVIQGVHIEKSDALLVTLEKPKATKKKVEEAA